MNKIFNFWFILERVASITLLLMVVILFGQVIARYIFNYSLYWSEEIAKFIFIYFVLIGACIVSNKKEHIKITYFYSLLPISIKKPIRIINEILFLFFLIAFFLTSLRMMARSFNTLSQALAIPWAYIYLAGVICSVIMFFDRVFSIFNTKKIFDEEDAKIEL